MSGFPSEAIFQDEGIPFSLATASKVIALTNEETPMSARTKNDTQAVTRATEHM